MNFDLILFYGINGLSRKKKWLDETAIFFARYSGYVFLVFLALAAVVERRISLLLVPLLAALVSLFLLNELVYFFYRRPRPPSVLSISPLIDPPASFSFPSNHASFFFARSFCLLLYSVPVAVAGLILSCVIGFCRVLCGVHWPSDILAGAAIGLVSFLIVFFLR
jgi:undecaprenyl-diphosphatase